LKHKHIILALSIQNKILKNTFGVNHGIDKELLFGLKFRGGAPLRGRKVLFIFNILFLPQTFYFLVIERNGATVATHKITSQSLTISLMQLFSRRQAADTKKRKE